MRAHRPLDLDACRKLGLGGHFQQDAVDMLMEGRLQMSPHPVWEIPHEINWDVDPFDTNWRFQFNMLRWLDPLRAAGAAGNHAALELWATYTRDWVEKNPVGSPQASAAWMDMADGLRALRLITAAPIIADYRPQDLGWLVDAIYTHRDWLADDTHWGHANHLLHQLQALVALGAVTYSQDHVELARIAMIALLKQSWDEQGVNEEGAIAYHRTNYVWWHEALDRFEAAGVERPAEVERLELAPIEIAHATRPDGTFVTVGDTDIDYARGIDHPACRWVTTAGAEGEPPEEVVKLYNDGYIYGRSGWGQFERDMAEETFFSLLFGRRKIHGHQDGGSLTFSANGVNWLVDPGKFSYSHQTPMRRHMMINTSHSLPYLAGVRRTKEAGVDLLSHVITDDHYEFSLEDRGFSPARVLRRVIYSTSGEYLVAIDVVRSRKDVTFAQRWQLGPGVKPTVKRQTVELAKGDAKAGLFFFGRAAELDVRVSRDGEPDGLVSIGWKRAAEAPAVVATKTGARERFVTFLVPGHGDMPTVSRIADVPTPVLAFSVQTRRTSEVIIITPDAVQILPGSPDLESIKDALAPPSASAGAPRDPLDVELRVRVADHVASARRKAWEVGSGERSTLAEELIAKVGGTHPADGAVLGIEGAIADLLQAPQPPPGSGGRPGLINWEASPTWKPDGLDMVGHSHRGKVDDPSVDQPGVHAVDLGELVLPMAFMPGADPFLTVDFHGALDRVKMQLPVFAGQRRERSQHSGHVLFVADATLDLSRSLRLGWFLGSRDIDLNVHIAEAVRIFAEKLGVKDIVLRGSSGGGFAALQVGAQIPESTVVVFNPQTDVRQYSPGYSAAAFEAAYGLASAPTEPNMVRRINAADRIIHLNQCPTIHYINNSQDKSHIERHFTPFTEALEEAGFGNRIKPQFHDFGPGHRRPSPALDAALLAEIYESLGFSPDPSRR